ncbi:acetyltransferase [Alkalihalobacillus pseudalcaliphilus]|uniref:acetyltransferase n=1 Tax=Alkalihalobacillus pseudalcaliphilus TaxID=79884 RepID=UPI00064DC315|nr:acetyltransferase [Alkalihalobacillus pseudalcaliphilus]KMK75037.1 acetyltransferase [Alkalihalobacillus pseudalcaliphilus]
MKVVIIGQGGHSKVIQDLIETNNELEVIGYLDDQYKGLVKKEGVYQGAIDSAIQLVGLIDEIKFIIAIGQNQLRKWIFQRLAFENEAYVSIIHATACISPSAQIGFGTVIMPYAVVNANSQIGNHSIINTSSVIEHDVQIHDFVHISPNATLTGSVLVEQGVHVGAGAIVIPGLKVGEWSVIGAGATVTKHIPAQCTAVGIPAKVKMKEGKNIVEYRE